jgi:hypothetical protein
MVIIALLSAVTAEEGFGFIFGTGSWAEAFESIVMFLGT